MTRLRSSLAARLALALVLAPGVAGARVGGGASMGSRGGMTFSAPPSTGTAQFAAPIGRSYTSPAPASPGYGAAAPAYGGGYRSGFGGGGFTSGLLGGLVGAGIGGMLFGHGMFGGIDGGGGSILGLLIQFAILFFVGRWLLRLVMGRQTMFAGLGGSGVGGARGGGGLGGLAAAARGPAGGAARSAPPIAISPADYAQFEQLLKAMQASWSKEDIAGLRAIATPEMASYFNEQLSELHSRGLRNQVADVRLEQGDLAQAWTEGSREYATVAMRFSMLDVTFDANERVVDGSRTERQMVTEAWTFMRSPGGRWMLSAIQQAR